MVVRWNALENDINVRESRRRKRISESPGGF